VPPFAADPKDFPPDITLEATTVEAAAVDTMLPNESCGEPERRPIASDGAWIDK
jgi:hypothetical protein